MTFFLSTLFPSVLRSAFFLSIDKEIGEAGVGYGKLKRIGVTKLGGKEQEIFWYSPCRHRICNGGFSSSTEHCKLYEQGLAEREG